MKLTWASANVVAVCFSIAGARAQSYGNYGGYGSSAGGYGSSPSPSAGPLFGPSAGSPPGSSPAGGPSSCTVTAYLASPWPLGGSSPSHANVVNLYVTSNDNETIPVPWTLSISNPAYKSIEQGAWNWEYVEVSGGRANGQAKQSWQALTPGYTVNLGCILGTDSANVTDYELKSATVNGASCSVSSVTA